jgi:radical SAM superfamily enzyme YgiQ (UPF0313 family)
MEPTPDTDYAEWYKTIYPRLTGSGLWMRGGETNTLTPEEYGCRPFRVLITRLSTAEDTAESSTHKLLYALIKSIPGAFPDLAFLPPRNDARLFDRDGVPWLLGTGTKRGPAGFDVIAFSNSIVQELVNLPTMLQRSGIPLRKSERMADASVPLVLLGGANAQWTSAFWTDDPPVDGVFVGESISCIEKLFSVCRDGKLNLLKKESVLNDLESVPGFFQPDRIGGIRKWHDPDLAEQRFFPDLPVSFVGDQPGRGTVAISEGCPSFCSFCSESYVRKPYRELPADAVVERALRMKASMGLDRVELSSFNFNVHGGFYDILMGLAERFDTVGLKSMRFDVLARDPNLLPALLATGKNSLTCGLEGVSPRIRSALDKSLSGQDLSAALRMALASPVRELKVFLIATGWEEKEDLDAFAQLLQSMKAALARTMHKPRVIFSATPLLRFPWTPLEFEDAPSPDRMRDCLDAIERTAAESGFELRRAASIPEWWLSQVLVRAADPRLLPALLRSMERTGFVFYRYVPPDFTGIFLEELANQGVAPADLLLGSDPDRPGEKPWEVLETGVGRPFLMRRHHKLGEYVTRTRIKAEGAGRGVNSGAGTDDAALCWPDPDARAGNETAGRITPPKTAAGSSSIFADRISGKRAASRRDEREFAFLVRLRELARGLPRNAAGAALARAWMLSDPRFADAFRRFKNSYWEDRSSPAWIAGDDVITLVFSGNRPADLMRLFGDAGVLGTANQEFTSWGRCMGLMEGAPETVSVSVRSPFPFEGSRYLKVLRLNHILKKSGTDAYQYEFTKDALRKNIIKRMSAVRSAEGTTTVHLVAGVKFDPGVFAKTAFALPHPSEWVRIEMESNMEEG